MPQGLEPALIRDTSLLVFKSTTETSFDGPLAVNSSFASGEKNNAIFTGQSHILEIENDAPIFPLRGDKHLQLGNVIFVEPSA